MDSFAFGADMVIYGNTTIDCGWNQANTPARHDLYTQNRPSIHGTKHVVGNTFLDVSVNPPSGNTRGTVHMGASGTSQATDSRVSGYNWKDNTHQGGSTFFVTYTPMPTNDNSAPMQNVAIDNMWMFGPKGTTDGLLVTSNQIGTIDIQNSLIVGTRTRHNRMWGLDTSGCWTQNDHNKFLNNRVYNPLNGIYLEIGINRYNASPCSRGGTALIDNSDEWDNNTYGRSSGTGTFGLECNGTNHGTANTLAQWRTRTDACRESGAGTAFDASSTEGGVPSTDEVECFENFYNPNWGKCRAVTWDGNSSVVLPASEVSKIIGNGKTYKVRNERDFFGTPLETDTWTTGTNVTVSPLPGDMVNGVLLVCITSQP